MDLYQCHKKVHAFKIKEINQSSVGTVNDCGGTWDLVAEEGPSAVVPHDFVLKHKPVAGGYYVVYEDGYASFSPAAAFESGYTKI